MFRKEEPKKNSPNDELRLALWFISKIGDPLRALQLVNAAVQALAIAKREIDVK